MREPGAWRYAPQVAFAEPVTGAVMTRAVVESGVLTQDVIRGRIANLVERQGIWSKFQMGFHLLNFCVKTMQVTILNRLLQFRQHLLQTLLSHSTMSFVILMGQVESSCSWRRHKRRALGPRLAELSIT